MERTKAFVCIASTLFFIFSGKVYAETSQIQALYIGSNAIGAQKVIQNAVELLKHYELNAVVVDKKDDRGIEFTGEKFQKIIAPFRAVSAIIICRIVVFRDNTYAHAHPATALKSRKNSKDKESPGELWTNKKGFDKKTKHHRGDHFLDPAMEEASEHIIQVSLRAIDDGCRRLNFDYIRFPGDGDLKDIVYPSGEWTRSHKCEVMRGFLRKLVATIRARTHQAHLSADVFGYAALRGDPGIGQCLENFAELGIDTYAMAYPSHYDCNELGAPDPNKIPYAIYLNTLTNQLRYLKNHGATSLKTLPWLQGFDYPNINGCGLVQDPKTGKMIGQKKKPGDWTKYATGRDNFREQIRAVNDVFNSPEFESMMNESGWIVWNPGGVYPTDNFEPKQPRP